MSIQVITGSGDYYSSGNDLSGMLKGDMSQDNAVGKALEAGAVMLEEFTLGMYDDLVCMFTWTITRSVSS